MNAQLMAADLLAGNTTPDAYDNEELMAIAAWACTNDKTKLVLRVAHKMAERGLDNKYTRAIWGR